MSNNKGLNILLVTLGIVAGIFIIGELVNNSKRKKRGQDILSNLDKGYEKDKELLYSDFKKSFDKIAANVKSA